MNEVRWERYPRLAESDLGRRWLTLQANLGLARNTIEAYGRALEDYVGFSARHHVLIIGATRDHIAASVRDMTSRPHRCGANVIVLDSGAGLANATLQQRLTAVRLLYDYLMEEGLRPNNPVGRGRFTPRRGFGGARERGLIPRFTVHVGSALRLGFAEELCSLETGDIDPAHSTVTIRAETTKFRQGRVVPYSAATAELLAAYLHRRHELTRNRGPLFISESRRNRGEPISIWMWSKAVKNISKRSGVAQYTTHTARHLCLTDLARANWDVHEIASFASHKSIQATLLYIHLSGRDLAKKLAQGMAQIHAWRTQMLKKVLCE